MIEPELRNPARRNVAGFAALPDLSEVYIIVDMAVATGGRERLIKPARMAAVARQVVVTCRKRYTCPAVVVKAHRVPAENAVTTATVGAEATLVNIIGKMAGATFTVAGIAEVCVTVTGFAGHALVAANQSEPGRCKVIESWVVPSLRAMTIRTLATVSALVYVISAMAGNAGTPNRREVILHMAGITGSCRVPAA